MKPDQTAGDLAGQRRSRRRQPVQDRRCRAKRVHLIQGPDGRRLDLGRCPVLLLSTGSDDRLTTDQWGAGPTAVALKQEGPWTYGALGNHIASFAGDHNRANINATFVQPFVTYTTPSAWAFTLQSESTYDWNSRQWAVPVGALVGKVIKVGDQLMSVGGGVRYWLDSPPGGPSGVSLRLSVTLLFPR